MYFPYLRGRQSELFALAGVASEIASNQRVVPIIEPVKKDTSQLIKTIKPYNFFNVPFILIVNPQEDELKNHHLVLEREIDSGKLRLEGKSSLGYIINPSTTLQDVRAFLKQYSSYQLSFIHAHSFTNRGELNDLMRNHNNISYQVFPDRDTEHIHQESFIGYQRVLVKDGFNKAKRNADFPSDELFSDLHLRYRDLGFDGFGDFTITGRQYDEGGLPHAIAIHLTYYNNPIEALRIRHFISDRTTTTNDPAGKFLEALVKLIEFLNKNPHIETEACKEFRALHAKESYPGLSGIKQLSIKHHIQLILGLMKKGII